LGDFEFARSWCLKSLAISEKHGDRHGSAVTHAQIGNLAAKQNSLEDSGRWFIRAIAGFIQTQDRQRVAQGVKNFLLVYQVASPAGKQTLEAAWHEANLGPFPTEPNP